MAEASNRRPWWRDELFLCFLIGCLVFALLAGFGAWSGWTRYSHTRDWLHRLVTVEKTDFMCDVQKKRKNRWDTLVTLECDAAPAYIAERDGVLDIFRTRRIPAVVVAYMEADQKRTVHVPSRDIADERTLRVGDQLEILVNPADPAEVDKPFSDSDIGNMRLLASMGLGLWVVVMLVGFMSRRARLRQEAERSASDGSSGTQPVQAR